MIRAFQKVVKRMRVAELDLKHHTSDNEASAAFKECIKDSRIEYKWVLPGNHCRKQAECAIQTF
jgi:hypothetical protein